MAQGWAASVVRSGPRFAACVAVFSGRPGLMITSPSPAAMPTHARLAAPGVSVGWPLSTPVASAYCRSALSGAGSTIDTAGAGAKAGVPAGARWARAVYSAALR